MHAAGQGRQFCFFNSKMQFTINLLMNLHESYLLVFLFTYHKSAVLDLITFSYERINEIQQKIHWGDSHVHLTTCIHGSMCVNSSLPFGCKQDGQPKIGHEVTPHQCGGRSWVTETLLQCTPLLHAKERY